MQMIPMPNARAFTPANITLEEAVSFIAKQNGFWARVEDGKVLWDLLPTFVADGAFVPNPLDADDADRLLERLTAMDNDRELTAGR